MSMWAPKPLRPEPENPLFEMVEAPVVIKGLSPIQRQRLADGSQHTITGPTALRPADPTLTLPETMMNKGSLVEKYDERPKMPKQEPEDPMTVVKSYLAKAEKVRTEPDGVSKSVDSQLKLDDLRTRIQDVLTLTGAK